MTIAGGNPGPNYSLIGGGYGNSAGGTIAGGKSRTGSPSLLTRVRRAWRAFRFGAI